MANTKPPAGIIDEVCSREGLVVDVYGAFDDPEVLVAAIGKKELLVKLH